MTPKPLLGAALLALFLSACATPSTGISSRYPAGGSAPPRVLAPGIPPVEPAEAALLAGDPARASRIYEQAAQANVKAAPTAATEYRLRAADAALAAADPVRAERLLDPIPVPTAQNPGNGNVQARARLLRAQAALLRNDPARVLRLLPAGDPGGDPTLAASTMLIRAQALARSNEIVAAVHTLVIRERHLSGIVALTANRDTIWQQLSAATLDSATMARAARAPTLTRGWIELAAIARRRPSPADYESWRRRFRQHPGEERVARLLAPDGATGNVPGGLVADGWLGNGGAMPAVGSGATALLLPDNPALAPITDALRAGYARGGLARGGFEPTVYPSSEFGRALAEGAGLIVGPLLKEELTLVAEQPRLPVPVLGLNYLDAEHAAPPGLYQFGLSPEDEAGAAAADAAARGLTRALVMVPDSDWGQRVEAAFTLALQRAGGQVVETGRYRGTPAEWAEPVKQLLRYVPMRSRAEAAAARARVGPDIDPQRRNDFDFVFIGGRAAQARVLWPLFRYYHADRTPAYATAAVNETLGDSDLDGIRFCDAPWLLEPYGPFQPLHDEAVLGRGREPARLYAFGADARMLAERISTQTLNAGEVLPGATGLLIVGADGAIRRQLQCARIVNRRDPVLLPPPEPAADPMSEPAPAPLLLP